MTEFQKEGPYAFRTMLGWCIVGTVGKTSERNGYSNHHCNKITVNYVNCVNNELMLIT